MGEQKSLAVRLMAGVVPTCEADFILRALEGGLRVDGRRALELRPVNISFGNVVGSVEVHIGDTKVMAVATAELVEPYPDRPAEGVLQFNVELSPMASPAFEGGRPSELAIEMMRLLDRSIHKSQAVDIESLCVVAGKRVWSLRCDVTVLDDCGNMGDAANLAALAALKHFRLPAVSVLGTGDEATVHVLPTEQAEPQPLVFHHMPVAVTLAFFNSKAGTLLHVLDPTDREELVMLGTLVVVLNQHQELCALHKLGGIPVGSGELLGCIKQVASMAPHLLQVLEQALQQHALKMEETAKILAKTGRLPQRAPQSSAPQSSAPQSIAENAAPAVVSKGAGGTADEEMTKPRRSAVVCSTASDVVSSEASVAAAARAAEASSCSGLLGDEDDEEEAVVLCSSTARDEASHASPAAAGSTKKKNKKKRKLN